MRILMTTDTVGGVWTFTSELARELLARGCDVALVSFGRAPSAEQTEWLGNLTIRYSSFQFAASGAPLEWMPDNDTAYAAGELLLLQLCNNFQPDVLLLSQFCFGALPVGVPKIVIAHSDVLSWAAAVGKAPLADDPWLRTYCSLVQRGLDDADAVIAPTRAMLHDLRAHFAVPQDAYVIPNGRTLPHVDSTSVRRLQAITAGRMWDEAKNLKLLADCVSPIPILIAGECSDPERSSECVTMLGRRSEKDLLALFQTSAIYICSSLYEPFGLAALEAALCGCAVLANDIPSLREVWGDAAFYFHDAASLTGLLTQLSESAETLAAAQARSTAKARTCTAERMAEHYLRLLQPKMASMTRGEAHAA